MSQDTRAGGNGHSQGLFVVDPDTGELRQPGCPACADHVAKITGLQGDLDAAKDELVKQIRKIQAMQRDREKERLGDPQRAVVLEVFEYWKERCNHPKSRFDGARFDLIKSALRVFSVDELKRAIDGAAVAAYVDPSGKRHDKLGLVLRNAEYIEDFINRYLRWRRANPERNTAPGRKPSGAV